MEKLVLVRVLFLILSFFVICPAAAEVGAGADPILLQYVRQPDASYDWEKLDGDKNMLGSTVTLSMTSQKWHGITWKHRLDIIVPPGSDRTSTAVLIIAGGNGRREVAILGQILASATKCPVAILSNIPNQPLFGNKKEDSLIATTFAKALETGDMTWPLLLPMTKSAVHAMDTVQAYFDKKNKQKITGFVVGGVSKRGWITWLTAAADPVRVKGIIPMVYDNLKLTEQMQMQSKSYGGYSDRTDDYTELGLQDKLTTEAGQKLAEIVDPWSYRDRITMPKLIINGTNDPYWTLTSLNIYWNDLTGDKSVLYVPNAEHDLGLINFSMESTSKLVSPMIGFIRAITSEAGFPNLDWKYECDAKKCCLRITADSSAKTAKLWIADSSTRDFRQAKWKPHEMKAFDHGFSGKVELPKEGYRAVFGEVILDSRGVTFPLSTQIRMLNTRGPVYP